MNILIIKDNPFIAISIGMIAAALHELSYNQIDAVLLDLKLSDSKGPRLAHLFRNNPVAAAIPVFVLQQPVDEEKTVHG